MKETFYFSHDYHARTDPKLIKVRMKLGMEGVGIYWSIIEMLYEENGSILLSDCERIAYELNCSLKAVESVISDCDLFFTTSDHFFQSKSVNQRLEKRKDKSQKATESINKRWNNTNVIRSNNDSNTNKVKENKLKEIKVKESNEEKVTPKLLEISTEHNQSSNLFKSMDDLKNICVNQSTQWQESMMKRFNINDHGEMKIWIEKFFDEMKAQGQDKRNLTDTTSHCCNWIRIQIEKEKSSEQKEKAFQVAPASNKGVAAGLTWAHVQRRSKK